MTDASGTTAGGVRGAWQQDEPAFVEAHVRPAFHPLRQLVVFPDALSSTNAEQQTAQIEQNAELYRVYCNDLEANVRGVVEMRTAYRTALTGLSTGLLTTLSLQLEQGTHTAVQTRLVCEQFLEQARVNSARTSDGLQAMMLAGGAQTQQAQGLVKQYFAGGRLRINKSHVGYTSGFDAKAGAFGAEWTLRAPDRGSSRSPTTGSSTPTRQPIRRATSPSAAPRARHTSSRSLSPTARARASTSSTKPSSAAPRPTRTPNVPSPAG